MLAWRAAAVAGGGALLVLLAFVFDAVPLFVPGIALGAIGSLAPLWVWSGARGARARRLLAAERIVEDEPLEATIEVRRGPLARGGWGRFEVLDPLTGSRLALAGPLSQVLAVSLGRTASVRVVARFHRRGEHVLAPPSLIVRDPLDLARVQITGSSAEQRLLVLPRTEPVRWLSSDRVRRLDRAEGDPTSEAMAATDLDGLRPYRPGTPASRIHWPAVARGRGLIERKLQADGDTRPLIVLDARGAGGQLGDDEDPHAERLDAAVRAAASLALDLARAGGCGLLLPGEQRPTTLDPELLAWPAAYARLALVAAVPDARAAAGVMRRPGPLIYITAAPAERLAMALTSAGGGTVVLVVPDSELVEGRPRGVPGRIRPTLEVSGCRGFALGARRGSARRPGPVADRSWA